MRKIGKKIKSLSRIRELGFQSSIRNDFLLVALGGLSAQTQLSNTASFEHLYQAEFRVYSQWG